MFKKVAMIAVSLCAGLTLQGCTDDEVATGAVIVGAVVIGAAIAAGGSSGSSGSVGRNDHGGRGDHRGGGRGYGRDGRRFAATLNVAQDTRVTALTEKYSLSPLASKKVVNAFDTAQDGKLAGFTTVGFSKDELQQLGVGMVPNDQTIVRISANLKTTPASLKYFLQDVADQAVIESSKWMVQGTAN